MTTRDRGAAAIWVLGCGAVLFVIALVIVSRTAAVLARHRTESAADLAALAAATRIGIGGDPCAAARRVAVANRAVLHQCSVSLDPGGRSGTVAVRVVAEVDLPVIGPRVVTAQARAGRLPKAVRTASGALQWPNRAALEDALWVKQMGKRMGTDHVHATKKRDLANLTTPQDRDRAPAQPDQEPQADAGALPVAGLATAAGPGGSGDVRRSNAGDRLGGTELAADLTQELDSARSGGRALPAKVARQFGEQIGADFSGVKVHDDSRADQLARSVESTAFTHGSDIFFSSGTYAPDSSPGQHLLAHELTHVAQNAGSPAAATVARTPTIGPADDPAEREAERVADSVLPALRRQGNRTSAPVAAQPGGDIHRLFNFKKWFGKKKPKDPAAKPEPTAEKPTTTETPVTTETKSTGAWGKATPSVIPTGTRPTLGQGRTSPTVKSSTTAPESTTTPTTTTPETTPTTGTPTTGEKETGTKTTETKPTTETVAETPVLAPKSALDAFTELVGTGSAPADNKEAIKRLREARDLLAGVALKDRDKISSDKALMNKARVFVGIAAYASLLAALGVKHTRKADKKKGVKATVDHMSGAEADEFIKTNMGALAHLKKYVDAAVKAGKQADGFIAVVDTDDWAKLYAHEFPSEPIGEEDELSTNAYVTNDVDEPAIIHSDRGTRSTAIHESVHRYAPNDVLDTFGFDVNEGVTEYFTRLITDKNGKPAAEGGPSRDNYNKQFKFICTLLPMLGADKVAQETALAEIYFEGKKEGLKAAYDKAWLAKKKKQDDIDKDWKKLVANMGSGKWAEAKALLP